MQKARVNKDVYGERRRSSTTNVVVKYKNSGNKKAILFRGLEVQIIPKSSSFEGGTEYLKVLTPDGRTLIVAETLAMCLTAFDVATDGSLSNRRVWADLSSQWVPPDGICLDADGAVWVANALAAECVRVIEGGEITDRQSFSQKCFACALGGPDGRTLLACTAASEKAARNMVTTTAKIEMAEVRVAAAR